MAGRMQKGFVREVSTETPLRTQPRTEWFQTAFTAAAMAANAGMMTEGFLHNKIEGGHYYPPALPQSAPSITHDIQLVSRGKFKPHHHGASAVFREVLTDASKDLVADSAGMVEDYLLEEGATLQLDHLNKNLNETQNAFSSTNTGNTRQ